MKKVACEQFGEPKYFNNGASVNISIHEGGTQSTLSVHKGPDARPPSRLNPRVRQIISLRLAMKFICTQPLVQVGQVSSSYGSFIRLSLQSTLKPIP